MSSCSAGGADIIELVILAVIAKNSRIDRGQLRQCSDVVGSKPFQRRIGIVRGGGWRTEHNKKQCSQNTSCLRRFQALLCLGIHEMRPC